jgi:Ni/Fe-hydrogenase b-type cytochrome subunit
MITATDRAVRRPGEGRRPQFTDAAKRGYQWVYLWSWPIRATHWAVVLSIIVLVVTGLYIGNPYFMTGGDEGMPFAMGWMRFLHFAAAMVLLAAAIIRVYWLFAGNKFERWKALFPVRPRDWVNLFRMVKFYLLIHPERAPHYIGHHPLQQLSYTALYSIALVEVLTGFALYGLAAPGGFWATAFGWMVPILGGWQMVRFIHHVLTWVFVIFIPIHLYLVLRADLLEGTGVVSSIISGGRFVHTDVKYEDD